MRPQFSPSHFVPVMLRSLWAYRGFIFANVGREFAQRYTHSLLGGLWAVLNPLVMILIYTLIFAGMMRASLAGHESNPFAYSIYLCAGLLPWNGFADIIGRLQGVFPQYANLLKKASFPRSCLPLIVVLSALTDFAIVFSLFLLFLLLIGQWPGWPLLALFPLLLIHVGFAVGLGLLTATMNVFFRDVGQFVGVALQFWFWFTPIVYSTAILSGETRSLLSWNPLYPLIQAYHGLLLDHAWPDWSSLLGVTVLTLLLLWLSARVFLRLVGEIVDEL